MSQRRAFGLARPWMLLAVFLPLAVTTPLRAEPSDDRTAVPDADAQEQSRGLVQDVFKDKYGAATTAERQAELADELFRRSRDPAESPASRYVLLNEAGKFAVKAKSALLALQIVNALGAEFAVDAFDRKVKVALVVSKTPPPAQEVDALTHGLLELLEGCVKHDQYEAAEKLGANAAACARKSKDAALVKQVLALNKEIKELEQRHQVAMEAMNALRKNPADPAANLAVGKYRCFVTADWQQGLPLLALGNDASLQALAANDLQGASEASDQAALGDGWWDQATHEEGIPKRHLQEQAALWYQRALPGLSGLVKEKVVKRMLVNLPAPAPAPAEREKLTEARKAPEVKKPPETAKPAKKTVAKPRPGKLPQLVVIDRTGITPGAAGDNLYPFELERVGRRTEARLFISGRGGLDSFGRIVLTNANGESGDISLWNPDVLKPNPINATSSKEVNALVLDITKFVEQPGPYQISFQFQKGNQGLIILRVEVESK